MLRSIQIGQYDLDGKPDKNAWKTTGFDLDCSVVDPSHLCTAPLRQEGVNGIDNEVGHDLVGYFGDGTQLEPSVDKAMASGAWSVLLSIQLGDAANDPDAPGDIYVGATTLAPEWSGKDKWDYPSGEAAHVSGFVRANVWASVGDLSIPIPATQAHPFPILEVRHATLVVDLATGGTTGAIAGFVDPTEVKLTLLEAYVNGDPKGCAEQAVLPIDKFADVLAGGAHGDTQCTLFSFGAKFKAEPALVGNEFAGAPPKGVCQ